VFSPGTTGSICKPGSVLFILVPPSWMVLGISKSGFPLAGGVLVKSGTTEWCFSCTSEVVLSGFSHIHFYCVLICPIHLSRFFLKLLDVAYFPWIEG
jgi:hypothetical protein